jgi:hypothetical protein
VRLAHARSRRHPSQRVFTQPQSFADEAFNLSEDAKGIEALRPSAIEAEDAIRLR